MNRLTVLDVLEDVRDAVQLNGSHTHVQLMPAVIKYRELYPGWSPAVTDAYMSGRQNAAALLVREGVLQHANIPRDWYGMGRETPLEIVADEATVTAALEALRRTFPSSPIRGKKSLLRRSASHIFATLFGATATLALMSPDTRHLWAVICISVFLLISVRGVPRLRRLPPLVVDIATVVGALAAVGAILISVFHLEIPKPGPFMTSTTTHTPYQKK
jgi:hypothetical protein